MTGLPSRPRVLVVAPGPHFSVEDVCAGWVEGLTAVGADVVRFNLDDRLGFYASHPKVANAQAAAALAAQGLEVAAYRHWPHVVLIVSGFYVPRATYELLRARGHRVVLHVTEAPYEDDRHAAKSAHADLTLVNDRASLDRYQQWGAAKYQPHCWRTSTHTPGPARPELVCDFGFVGTGYPSRVRFLREVQWPTSDVLIGGNWRDGDWPPEPWMAHPRDACMDNMDTVDLYRSARVGANLYRVEASSGDADGWSVGPREVEMAAVGLPFLRQPREEGDALFPDHPSFDDPEGFAEGLRYLLKDEGRRRRIALAGRAAVADRTFTNAAKALLTALDQQEH